MTIVAIVGIDGSGKTTQAKMLVRNLKSQGYDATYVEPVFFLLRLLMKSDHERLRSSVSPRNARKASTTEETHGRSLVVRIVTGTLGYLYAFLTYVILARKSFSSKVVVCDRYFFQFFYDLYGERAVSFIDVLPKPDITFFLQGQVVSLHSRMTDPSDAATSWDYFSEVDSMYDSLSKRYCFNRVDAESEADLIGQELLEKVINASKSA
jgi:dTMP kinase